MSMDNTVRVEHVERLPVVAGLDRVRWGAVFAGLFFAVVTQILLAVLGLAIGFTAVDPREGMSGAGIGWGAAIWAVVSLLISMFVGGYMTGRLSGVATRGDGALNGALTWAVSLVAMLYMGAVGAGALMGGVFSMVGTVANTTAQIAGQGAAASASNGHDVVNEAKQLAQRAGIDVDRAQQQAEQKAQDVQQSAERATQPGTPENQQAKEIAAKAADYAATGAWSLLIAALIGLLISAWAGAVGAGSAEVMRTRVRVPA